MKKIINSTQTIVDDMIRGYISAHSDRVAIGSNPRVVIRARTKPKGRVGLVIGNGSGHEPIAMGWVGEGLLDSNAVGEIFAAPSPSLIVEGIQAADFGVGSILLISSHSGDILNSEVAIEEARDLGTDVRPILMYDDVSSAPKGRETERRGAPGTTFIYKIVGAAAEEGRDIGALISLGERVRDQTRTLGVAVSPGISPLNGKPMFELSPDEIFVGMGVHGEPGLGQRKLGPASELVNVLMTELIEDYPFSQGDEVIPFVNGSGGTTLMELLIIYGEVARFLDQRSIGVFKPMVGEMVTTQEMGGFSISLLKTDEEMNQLWASPCSAPYFHV